MDEQNRKIWNERQQELKKALSHPRDHHTAVELFLIQHSMVHSARITNSGVFSFDDEVCQGLSEEAFRTIPPNGEHSIAWMLWHITRIEDMTMNTLIAGSPQVFDQEGWAGRLWCAAGCSARDTGNSMNRQEIEALSAALDFQALREYRLAVGLRTQEMIRQLQPGELARKVDPDRLQQLRSAGDVLETDGWLLEYWGRQKKAGLLLMPATRHNIVHFNEALRVRKKLESTMRRIDSSTT
ncbi:MAG: DinB family protein [Chloroflexi bacterium]|nr:DinB family protein [Chloroflexota bacterium]